ncbi:sodium-coupled monocarboxylate transporter 1 [Elysia marginata]|uniref:Sodium-coupled monocarboxylate transporter 1 n=1 Tax=Elysia marginata TaxID=1093978 RepID=A0AAV4H320_9GAST|nr:sodium-coupled monocarboxylate transporter 1 [Elysia marginata]
MSAERVSYSAADYVVGSFTLLVPVGIGVWYAFRDVHRATRDEYLLGGRQMSVLPVALSTFITFMSAITLMGIPAETFFFGGIVFSVFVGHALSHVFGYFTIVPLLHPLQLTSVYEYLKLRYKSEAVRLLSTIIGMLTNLLYQSLVLLSPALALQACADLPLWMSIAVIGAVGTLYTALGGFKSVIWTDVFQTCIVFVGMFAIIIKGISTEVLSLSSAKACADLPLWMSIAVIGAVGTLYTALGGFKSVIWTDVFQTCIVFVGMFAIIIKACMEVGGLGEVWRLSRDGGRLKLDNFSLDPRTRHTQWSLIVGFFFMK